MYASSILKNFKDFSITLRPGCSACVVGGTRERSTSTVPALAQELWKFRREKVKDSLAFLLFEQKIFLQQNLWFPEKSYSSIEVQLPHAHIQHCWAFFQLRRPVCQPAAPLQVCSPPQGLSCTCELNLPEAWGRASFCKCAGRLGVLSGPQVSLKSTKAVSRVTILTQLQVVLLYLTAGKERATNSWLPSVLQLNTQETLEQMVPGFSLLWHT